MIIRSGTYRGGRYQTPGVVQANLISSIDAGNPASYPGLGDIWTDTVGGKTWTLINGPSYDSGNGGSIQFVPANSQWALATSFASALTTWTVETWHYYDGTSSSGSPCLVTEEYVGGPINFTVGNCTDSAPNVQVGYWDGGSFHPTPQGTVLTVGQWYQVVGIYNGTENQLYINGEFVSSTASASVPGSSGAGIRLMSRWDNAQYWGGKLAIVRIYDASIGASGVSQNFIANRSRFGI
jgi:hypothetical protein